jgi:protein gp37
MGQQNYANGFEVTTHPHMLDLPLRWNKPKMIFVNSMSDLFHEQVPEHFILDIFQTMQKASWHTFQVLTKRSSRLAEMSERLPWPDNVWVGVTIENSDCAFRLEHLKSVPAALRFLSMEPLLGPVANMNLEGIDWVIVGGESGPGARPMAKEWILDIRKQCNHAGVSFFFKQWGGINKKRTGRLIDGKLYDDMPRRIACV